MARLKDCVQVSTPTCMKRGYKQYIVKATTRVAYEVGGQGELLKGTDGLDARRGCERRWQLQVVNARLHRGLPHVGQLLHRLSTHVL